MEKKQKTVKISLKNWELLKHRSVCIIRHKQNVTWSLLGKNPESQGYLKQEVAKRTYLIKNRKAITRILANYGINERWVPK